MLALGRNGWALGLSTLALLAIASAASATVDPVGDASTTVDRNLPFDGGLPLAPVTTPAEQTTGEVRHVVETTTGHPDGGDPNAGNGSGNGSGGSGNPPPPTPPPQSPPAPLLPGPRPLPSPAGLQTLAAQTVDGAKSTVPIGMVTDLEAKAQKAAHSATDPLLNPTSAETGQGAPSSPKSEVSSPLTASQIIAGSLVAVGAAAATFFGFWLAGSSTTTAVGAKAAGTAASRDLRKLLPFASPLFTRFERDTVLGHPRREAIYALILQTPGVSLQALARETGLSRTAVLHHLRLIESQHLIVSRRVGRSRHYFENGGRYGHDQKEAYALLQNARSKDVVEFVRSHPGSMQKALCAALGIQPSIAHWHVRRLEMAGLLRSVRQGRTVAYFPGSGVAATSASSPLLAQPSLTGA